MKVTMCLLTTWLEDAAFFTRKTSKGLGIKNKG